jgi:tetratricopeptide (TPR) repeat protein
MNTDAGIPGNPAQQFGILLRRLIDGRQWDRALEVAREWLSQDPENAEAHLAAGQALVNLGKYAPAQVHMAKVLAARPNHVFALRLASIASANQQKMAEADEYIRRAIELHPNDAMNWYQLALMRYRQGSLKVAEEHARKALELQPENADTINLIANCQRGNPSGQLQQYLRALEINPESSIVHNNLGTYYLNAANDLPAAEACYRRALQCDPANEMAQRNLFLVLRSRDPVYRVLNWPRTLIGQFSWGRRDRTMIARIGLLILWFSIGRYFLLVFAAWLMLVWPLVKAYEYLTLGDIRAKAGIVGARRGGWKGFHRWPVTARLAIFAALVMAFWGGLFWLYEASILPPAWIVGVGIVALVAWYAQLIPGWWKRTMSRAAANRGEKKFRRAAAKAKAQGAPDPT